MIDFIDFFLDNIKCIGYFFMINDFFFVILFDRKKGMFDVIILEKTLHENICIVCIQQFFLRDLFDLVWLEHRVRDVLRLVQMLQLDEVLHLNQLLDYVFLVLLFLRIYEENRVLHHQPIYTEEISYNNKNKDTNTFFCIFK